MQLFLRKAMLAHPRNNKPCYDDPLHWDECLDGWWHAYRIGIQLSMYLRSSHDGEMPGLTHLIVLRSLV